MKFLKEFKDDTFDINETLPVKNAARAIVFDKNRCIALINYSFELNEEKFDFYATPGGGIETGESPEMAIKREVLEELGFECNILHEVGIIVDYYNIRRRKTVSNYFVVEVTKKRQIDWTEEEKDSIKSVDWLEIEEAVQLLERAPSDWMGRIIQRRDLYALNEAKRIMDI